MPHLIVIEGHEGQRRQLEERVAALEKGGWPLQGKFEAALLDWRALFENARSRGLFAERQVIVAEAAEALGPFPDELAEYLEDAGADSVVIAVFSMKGSGAADVKKAFSKGVTDLKKIVFLKGETAVPPWKRKDWLMGLARDSGLRLAPDAAALLGESIESQEELRGELAKLGLYADGREIRTEDVRALSFDEGGRAQLTFLDGVCQAKPKDVARSLRYLRETPLLPVLTALCNRLRPALYNAAFPRSREGAMKAIGMASGKDYALRMAGSALSAFGPEAVREFLLKALRLSFMEKTSRSEGWPGFELSLWEFMASARGARR